MRVWVGVCEGGCADIVWLVLKQTNKKCTGEWVTANVFVYKNKGWGGVVVRVGNIKDRQK